MAKANKREVKRTTKPKPARGPDGRFLRGGTPDKPVELISSAEEPRKKEDPVAAGKVNSGILGTISKTGQQPPAPVADSGGHDPAKPIGPGNPPRAGQIKPGEVRNPKGYPTGRKNAKTVIKYWLGQEEIVLNPMNPKAKEEGDFLQLTVLDVMTLGLINKARQGSVIAYRELIDRIEGKPVQSTKLLGADDQVLRIEVGFAPPKPKEADK